MKERVSLNGPVLRGAVARVAWYRFLATFRRRWSGYLALAVLIGLVGGVAMASMAAARRTDASYPKFLADGLPGIVAVIAYRQAPHRMASRGHSGDRRPSAARVAVATRLPASGVEGLRSPWTRGGGVPRCRSARSWPERCWPWRWSAPPSPSAPA